MAGLAFAVEKAVLRSIRTGRTEPRPAEGTPLTASGNEVSAD
jgi:hypothetical protein